MTRVLAAIKKLGAFYLFGIAMFTLGSLWTAFLMAMGEQFIRSMIP